MEIYRDSSLRPEERAKDLLSKMNLREKVGQLNQRLYGFQIYDRDGEEIHISDIFKNEVEYFGGIGVLYGLYRADPWSARTRENGITPAHSMKVYNMLQRYIIENTRLGIPMMMSSECPHGHQALGGVMLPVNLAAGCTFEPKLLKKAYSSVGEQLKDGHVELALMSVLDVLRDARWGRSEECYSEDPLLSARMAAAAVSGMQQSKVYAVAKHFCAQGEGTGGVNASAARIGERELREIHIPPMEACCKEKVKGVMAAYNEIDGVFCHANRHLLEDILRTELGFEGIVMADGVAIDNLNCVTGDTVRSGALARRSGVDVSLWDQGFSKLEEAVQCGYITEEKIDEAVLRVLTLKFESGLFENPYMTENMKEGTEYNTDKLSYDIAVESVVLLKNDDILPLTPEKYKKIAVIGPNADDVYRMLGDYTPPVDNEREHTLRYSMQQGAYGGQSVVYELGCGLFENNAEAMDKALEIAKESDVVVLSLGGSSSRYEGVTYMENGAAVAEGNVAMECGEGMDVAELELPKAQRELAEKLKELGRPIVTVITAGRPYAIEKVADMSNAFIYACYGGINGAAAIADIIYGKKEPAGRLSFSIPKSSGQLPCYYNYKNSYAAMKYCDVKEEQRYIFGCGGAYTEFEYNVEKCSMLYKDGKEQLVSDMSDENVNKLSELDKIKVLINIKNKGDRKGAAVPQLYIQRLEGSTTRRIRELKDFKKVWIEAGKSVGIELELTTYDLSVWNLDMIRDLEPGKVELYLADSGKEFWKQVIKLV